MPDASKKPTKIAAAGGKRVSSVAAGAARAGGERARRRGTPLIVASASTVSPVAEKRSAATKSTPSSGPASASQSKAASKASPAKGAAKKAPTAAIKPVETDAGETAPIIVTSATHRPAPTVRSGPSRKARKSSGTRAARPTRAQIGERAKSRPLRAVANPPAPDVAADTEAPASSSRPSGSSTVVVPGVEEMLRAGIAALRAAATAAGIAPEDVEVAVARTLAFIRRRIEGDYSIDDFGFDQDFTDNIALPMLRPLYQKWFRVEVRGIENIPTTGGALVVANHSGTVAVDSLMTQVAIHDEHPANRHLRMLGADLVFETPFLGSFARRSGTTLAANADAERLLTNGELVGVWPEGFKGVGKLYTERYKLQRFGRGGFVSAAIRTGVPIIPCSIVGAEEIYPIVGNLKTLGRLLGLPYFPVTANMALGPLAVVPFPSKWIIEFGTPVETADLGAAAAEDPMLVFDLTDQVRETIQQSLYALLMQRRSVFF